MADPRVTHATAADPTFSAKGAEEWGKDHTITGLNSTDSPTFTGLTLSGLTAGRVVLAGTGGLLEDDAGLTYDKATDALTVGGNITTSTGIFSATAAGTHNFGGSTLYGDGNNIYLNCGSSTIGNFRLNATGSTKFQFAGDGSSVAEGGAAGSATSEFRMRKPVPGFSNGVAKSSLTFTIPAGAHSGSYIVSIDGTLGASEACGSTQNATYIVNISRQSGSVADAKIGAVIGQPAATASGTANTMATTATVSAVSGAAGATNTFTLDVTLTRSGGTSDNHEAMIHCSLKNKNPSGITMA